MSLTTGQLLQGRYRIIKQLGQGGMGAVYLAEDMRLAGRRCAIKEQQPDPKASPQALFQLRQQFQMEASTLAALDHPNLPKVSDYFSDGGNEYLVMDYIDGQDLQSILAQQNGTLSEQSVLLWADQVLSALLYLHNLRPHPIIHRDIKPANIIVTPQGQVKLVDFGLVKLLDPTNPGTATIMKGMGTPAYTPLEQYASSYGHTDGRSDIYALGATLYHLLTHVEPPDAHERFMDPTKLAPPRQHHANLSAGSEAAIMKAMAIHPDQRYQSVQEFRDALAGHYRFMPTEVIDSSRSTAVPRRLIGLMIAVLLLLVILVGGRSILLNTQSTATIPIAAATKVAETPSISLTSTPINTPSTPTIPVTAATTVIETPFISPTSTATPSVSPIVATITATESPVCTPDLNYVADVTISDGTEIQKGSTFVKTWRVRNSGTCDWDSSYALLFVDGYLLGSPSAKVPALKPAEEANITLDLVAPTTPGTYRATWQLHAEGKAVGEFLSVVINVQDTATNTPTKSNAPTLTATPTKSNVPTLTATPTKAPPSTSPDPGSTIVSDRDGMVLVFIPAGEFLMGSAPDDPKGEDQEKPQHTVYLDGYWIDQTEVSNAMFARFTTETGYQTDAEKGGGGEVSWRYTNGANWRNPHGPGTTINGLDNYPVTMVSWNDATAYCAWAGRRLLTEAEWEKAARGTDVNQYPWGNHSPAGNLANFGDLNLSESWADSSINDGYEYTAPVGSYPAGASPYGVQDMAGNLWEWVADWFDSNYYANSPYDNPQGPSFGEHRVLKGGSWYNGIKYMRPVVRLSYEPQGRSLDFGFRCARDLLR